MFDHSIKVPRLYKQAAKVALNVSEGRGSIKQLVYEKRHPNIKGLYALVVNTFQRTSEIENLLKKSKLLEKEPRLDPWLAKILITELLWGKKRLIGEAKPIKTVLAYEQILKAHMSDVSDDLEDLRQGEKPRYVRVNTLKITMAEAIEGFKDEGWVLKHYSGTDYPDFLDAVSNLGPEEFMTDIHIPNLLIFPPKTQFYKHPAYKNGSILLQDKASCLPVHLLNPKRGSTILDMCAAPGMKTTQTAAMIENDGLIYAVEIGSKRYKTLTEIVEAAGATCVKPINRDVLTLTDSDCPNVQYILVDPSCSGSGITDRIEIGQQKKDQHQYRLQQLAAFQITTLRYALNKFPKAKRVVYSTCSVYPEENEDVVRQVLESCSKFKLVPAGDLIGDKWLNFGSTDFGDIGKYCLYAKPDIDQTSGFFVAVFERLKRSECNQFLNTNAFLYTKKFNKKRKLLQDCLDKESEEGGNRYEDGEVEETEAKCDNQKKKHKTNTEKKNIKNEIEFKLEKDETDLAPSKKKKKRKYEKDTEEDNESKPRKIKKEDVKLENTNEIEEKENATVKIKQEELKIEHQNNITKKKKKKDKHDNETKVKLGNTNEIEEKENATMKIKQEELKIEHQNDITKKKKKKDKHDNETKVITPNENNATTTSEIRNKDKKQDTSDTIKRKKKKNNNKYDDEVEDTTLNENDVKITHKTKNKKKKKLKDK